METKVEFKVASLGDAPKKNLVLIRENHPLPTDRKAIINKVGEILSLGKVQRITVAIGLPIQVDRFVEQQETGSQVDIIPTNDLWFEIRNGTLLEYLNPPNTNVSGLETMYRAWQMVTDQECHVEVIFVPPNLNMKAWLGIPLTDKEFFGAKIEVHKEMPEGAVLLAGVSSLKTIGIRVPVDMPKKGKK